MSNILEIVGLKPVKPWTTNKVEKLLPNPAPSLLYGLELEIESASGEWTHNGLTIQQDGSLRNNGYEYILKPMTYSHVAHVLNEFFTRYKINANNYSERCSTHVHINVQDLTLDQLAALCATYQVFERLLFNWVKNGRDKNIFCVPWYDTIMTYKLISNIKNNKNGKYTYARWQKYTALNITPVITQGTLEFRHLEGTCDIERILTWMRMIGSMYQFAVNHGLDGVHKMFINLNTTSEYRQIIDFVFGVDAAELRQCTYEPCLEEGVLKLKYACLNESVEAKQEQKPAQPQFIWDGNWLNHPIDEVVPRQANVQWQNAQQMMRNMEIQRHQEAIRMADIQMQRQAEAVNLIRLRNRMDARAAQMPVEQEEEL